MTNAVPADAHRSQPIQVFAPHEEQARSLRSQHPFVTIGGQKIDPGLRDIERKDAQALDGIQQQQGTLIVDHLRQFLPRRPANRWRSQPN